MLVGRTLCLRKVPCSVGWSIRCEISFTYLRIEFRWTDNAPAQRRLEKGERLAAAWFYTVDVSWQNETGELVKRAGLQSWRVTTFHMDPAEASSGARGSGATTLAAVFGLAMRDQHRVFAGDFNQAHHYIVSTLDTLIATKQECAAVTYECLKNPHSPQAVTILFNYPGSIQLTGEVKRAAFNRHSRFCQSLHLNTTDTPIDFPHVLHIYEKDAVWI